MSYHQDNLRFPRTSEEAFGPYCGMKMAPRRRKGEARRYVLAAVLLIAALVMALT